MRPDSLPASPGKTREGFPAAATRQPPLELSFPACSLVAKCQRAYAQNKKGNVENNGFEPLTPCLQSRCSSQLS